MPGLAWSSGRNTEVGCYAQPQVASEQAQQRDELYSEQDVTCMVVIASEAEQRYKKHSFLQAPVGLQQPTAPALLQLPAPALAAIAEHLTTEEKLHLARLVFGKAHQDAAAAVLATVRSCTVKTPACICHPGVATQHAARCCPANITTSSLAALSSMGLLQQLSLQLHLQEQERHWPAAMGILSGLTRLTSLEVQLEGATCHIPVIQQQAQCKKHTAAHPAASLLQAVGQLQHCNHLSLQLEDGPAAGAVGGNILLPDMLQPLLRLSNLQSLSLLTSRRLPLVALQQIAMMSSLTSLQLASNDADDKLANMTAGSPADCYEAAAVHCLQQVCPQLRQLSLIGYFPQESQKNSSEGLLQLLHCLNPKLLQQLDLSHNGSSPFPKWTAAVAALTSLQSLRIAGTAVTADVIAVLGHKLCQLTQLDIGHTNTAALQQHDQYGEAVQPLQLWLPYCSGLRELRLQGRVLTLLDMLCIFELSQLQHLDIAGAHLDSVALAAALTRSCSRSFNGNVAKLARLSLKDIRIGPDKFASVKLERLSGLVELDLRGCRPGATAVAALRRAVPGLRVVLMEDLDWADEGLEWLIGDYY